MPLLDLVSAKATVAATAGAGAGAGAGAADLLDGTTLVTSCTCKNRIWDSAGGKGGMCVWLWLCVCVCSHVCGSVCSAGAYACCACVLTDVRCTMHSPGEHCWRISAAFTLDTG